jgi:hypothetical protein
MLCASEAGDLTRAVLLFVHFLFHKQLRNMKKILLCRMAQILPYISSTESFGVCIEKYKILS